MKKYQLKNKMGRMSGFRTVLVILCFYKYLLNTGFVAIDAVYVHDKERVYLLEIQMKCWSRIGLMLLHIQLICLYHTI
jgi:hypothetical protein